MFDDFKRSRADASSAGLGRPNAFIYKREWDDDFGRQKFSPFSIRFLATLAAIHQMYGVAQIMHARDSATWGGPDWALKAMVPRIFGNESSKNHNPLYRTSGVQSLKGITPC